MDRVLILKRDFGANDGWADANAVKSYVFCKLPDPFVVHSTNAAALNRLSLMGVEAEYLYLFGNIPWRKPRP